MITPPPETRMPEMRITAPAVRRVAYRRVAARLMLVMALALIMAMPWLPMGVTATAAETTTETTSTADNATAENFEAGSFEAGLAAYQAGNYETAIKILRPLADAGDARAQERMAAIYLRGLGVEPDDDIANHYLHLAAEQGETGSQTTLGLRYLYGEAGIKKNQAIGVQLLNAAANKNHVVALTALGIHYSRSSNAQDVRQADYNQSEIFFSKAAKAGFPSAQKFLGLLYLNKNYTAHDMELGFMWLRVSKLNGGEEEKRALEEMNNVIRNKMTFLSYMSFQIKIERLARRCIESGYEDCG